ncbi:MAG: lysine--tRNA ligase [Parcubacteria group bacterium]
MLEDIVKTRKEKLSALIAAGIDPYPATVKRTHSVKEVLKSFTLRALFKTKISLAGRVMGFRDQGKLIFTDLDDGTGRIQALLSRGKTEGFDTLKSSMDIGDFISVTGTLVKTKKGEKSIRAESAKLIVKSLRPLPSEHFGVSDTETRLRKRYLELALNPETREMFRKKAVFWQTFRQALIEKGFLEVETPVLERTPGGAEAEPFATHYNALDTDFYLRISLEISLKKLLIGGYDKVFEIGRIFRNEGIDAEHLQDYTQLEFYLAYADYETLMKFVENLYRRVIKSVCGTLATTWKGNKIDWSREWKRVDYFSVFKEKTGIDLANASVADLSAKAEEVGIAEAKSLGYGRLVDVLFKKLIRPEMINPVFLVDPPIEIEPLAKRLPDEKNKVARFQIIACGSELGKGFSEANDPLDEKLRFKEQMKLRELGDEEAQMLDEEFLEALEYGMPPTAGFGISERFFSVLMDKPIRETVFFPAMKNISADD